MAKTVLHRAGCEPQGSARMYAVKWMDNDWPSMFFRTLGQARKFVREWNADLVFPADRQIMYEVVAGGSFYVEFKQGRKH